MWWLSTTPCCISTHQPSGWSLIPVCAEGVSLGIPVCTEGVSLGSNIVSGPLDDVAEPDTDVPPDGLTDMESIMGLIIWPKELKKKKLSTYLNKNIVVVIIHVHLHTAVTCGFCRKHFVNLYHFLRPNKTTYMVNFKGGINRTDYNLVIWHEFFSMSFFFIWTG